ncbi:MAG: hypothetical protein KF699_12980 [Phycisphaeraceae bacterium]|nr:hypothetical protein [Phycisphaeraceae bacterium]
MFPQRRQRWTDLVRRAIAVGMAICCFGAIPARAQITQYAVYRGAESLSVAVALSDGDLLTFRAATPGGAGMFGLQPSAPPAAGGVLLTIRGQNFASPEISHPSMSSSGAMCFTDIDVDGRSAIFTRSAGGTLLTIRGDNFGSYAGAFMGGGSIGTILGDFRNAAGQAALLAVQPGGSHITIVGDNFGARGFGRARSGAGGRTYTLFDAFPVNGIVNSGILSIGDDGTIITIVGRDQFQNVRGPAVSNDTIVFTGLEVASGVGGVFARAPGGSIITIHGQHFIDPPYLSEPAANDAGAVVFARLGAANGGVERIHYTDMFGGPLQTLVAVGDPLLDSTVVELFFNPDGLNQAGDFAYGARLADGSTAIMIATGIPAPGAAALLGLGAIAAGRRRR